MAAIPARGFPLELPPGLVGTPTSCREQELRSTRAMVGPEGDDPLSSLK